MRIKDDSKIKNILKIVSPGTNLREGLENILRAKTGGLIVLSDNEEVMKLVDGGFYINSEYSPAYIYELAKMDGAIVISEDLKRIVCANAQLLPDPSVSTFETGTRHRTAQRIAKQEFNNTDTSLDELSKAFSTHLNGKLCDNCREVIENEIGTSLFYLVSLCNILDINLYDVLINETSKLDTLGKFTFR